jgi:hypothetical protein
MEEEMNRKVRLVSGSLDFCKVSDVMPILDNLSVISARQD